MFVLSGGSAGGDTREQRERQWLADDGQESSTTNGVDAADTEEANEVFHLRLQVATGTADTAGRSISRLPASGTLAGRSVRSTVSSLPRTPRVGFAYALDLSRREAAGLLRQLEEDARYAFTGGMMVRPEQIAAVEVRSTVHPAAETLRLARLLQRAGLSLSRDAAGTESGSGGLPPEVEMVFAAGRRRSGAELSQD